MAQNRFQFSPRQSEELKRRYGTRKRGKEYSSRVAHQQLDQDTLFSDFGRTQRGNGRRFILDWSADRAVYLSSCTSARLY